MNKLDKALEAEEKNLAYKPSEYNPKTKSESRRTTQRRFQAKIEYGYEK